MTPSNSPAALVAAVAAVRGAIRRDRRNRYSLVRDWTLPPCRCSWWPGDLAHWETPLLAIERVRDSVVRVTVRAYQSTAEDNVCDGATLSPDDVPGILPAALFHDPWYYRGPDGLKTYEALAELVNLPARTTRQFGDALFYAIARAGGCPRILARLYYAGIRIGYPVVRPFLAGALLAALLAGGCAGGCISQGDDGTFLDPSQFDPPAWERVQ